MTSSMTLTTPSDREIAISRRFSAPRALVFDCWTKPELLTRWLLGPDGWTFTVCEVDLRVGGAFRYVWHKPDEPELSMSGVYREILPPAKIVTVSTFNDDWTNGETIETLELFEDGAQTVSVQTILYASKEARDGVLKSGMERGMEAGFARLDAILSQHKR
jgi:uncharacterized protein YndB with AHSA1/START domain